MKINPGRAISTIVLALAIAGCADTLTQPEVQPRASTYGATLVECPTDATKSATGLVLPTGGSVEVDGTSISLPAGAVLLPTYVTVTLPASNYMEVDIKANDLEHFEFQTPVSVTIDYARCTRGNINHSALQAWYIDSTTKSLLENMGGVDDKVARTVTFATDHLSGYAIAE